jgi:DNA primase
MRVATHIRYKNRERVARIAGGVLTLEGSRHPIRASDFYAETVLPALAERLDAAFPEFGWRRDTRGWVATNERYTHSRLGVRAERVVAHGPAPRGFLIHGGDSTPWTAYVNGGVVPRGHDFVRVVREIAGRAGIDPSPLDRPQPRDRRTELLRDFFELCRTELAGAGGASARAYLEGRGLSSESIAESGLGVVPASTKTDRLLEHARYRPSEIARAGVLSDSRWPGRLCGAWRDAYGRIGTFWARAVDDAHPAGTRYLYLRGASRASLPPYGLSELLANHDARRELVLVEGFLDVHQLRAQGVVNVAALGGTSIRPRTFEHLHRLGIDAVTLCLDNDEAGRTATAKAVENSARARQSPEIYVIDPGNLAGAKDPDEFVRQRGRDAWRGLIAGRACGIEWRARELVADIDRESLTTERRVALARAGRWLGTLQPRLALHAEDAVGSVAERCGYSVEATTRALRARFWREPERDLTPARPQPVGQVIER